MVALNVFEMIGFQMWNGTVNNYSYTQIIDEVGRLI
jgi:hypothetical protein